MRTHAKEDMDWEPLRAVLTDDAVGYWMWMGAAPAPDGSPVHFYKHSWTRRYLRLDGEGRVYAEDASGMPVPLPGCGGATLLVLLLLATASFDLDLGERLTIPEGARREQTRIDDLPALLEIVELLADDLEHHVEVAATQDLG